MISSEISISFISADLIAELDKQITVLLNGEIIAEERFPLVL